MSKVNEKYNSTINNNISKNTITNIIDNKNNSFPSKMPLSTITQKSSTEILSNSFKAFIESIPQSFLLICVLILFILFFIVIIIILICLIIKKKKSLQIETIINKNKIGINKMILQNNITPNLKDFHAIQNNSNLSQYSSDAHNNSLNEIKAKNLKEEIHSIISGTLNEMVINKSRKMKKKRIKQQQD